MARHPARATLVSTGPKRFAEAPPVDVADQALTGLGLEVERLDLERAEPTMVETCLAGTDVTFVTGGHSLFLAEHAQRSGFSSVVPKAVRAGRLVYAGMSSGGFHQRGDALVDHVAVVAVLHHGQGPDGHGDHQRQQHRDHEAGSQAVEPACELETKLLDIVGSNEL